MEVGDAGVQTVGDLSLVLLAQNTVLDGAEDGLGLLGGLGDFFGVGEVVLVEGSVEEHSDEGTTSFVEGLEALGAVRASVLFGVLAVWEEEAGHGDWVGGDHFYEFGGGFDACVVAVHGDDEFSGFSDEPGDASDVVLGDGGSAGSHCVGEVAEVEGYNVGVSLGDDQDAVLLGVSSGVVEPEEHVGLLVEPCGGGVDELCGQGVVVEEASGSEACDASKVVGDGPHEASSEGVEDRTVISAACDSCFYEVVVFVALGLECFYEASSHRREPHPPLLPQLLLRQLPLPQELTRRLVPLLSVEVASGGVDFSQRSVRCLLVLPRMLRVQSHVQARREVLYGLHESHPLDFSQEVECISPGTTAEALVRVALRIDSEGRGALVMVGQWAEGFPLCAGARQMHIVVTDELNQIDTFSDLFNLFAGDDQVASSSGVFAPPSYQAPWYGRDREPPDRNPEGHSVPKYKPTAQQQAAIDAFHTGEEVTISAGAGCGKSSTLRMIADSTTKRGLLLSFNRAVAEENARGLNGTNTTALNTHRIAYGWARQDHEGSAVIEKLNSSSRVRRDQIARAFNIHAFNYADGDHKVSLPAMTVVNAANDTLRSFMQDGSHQVSASHLPTIRGLEKPGDKSRTAHNQLAEFLVPIVQKMWENVLSPSGQEVRVTHDAYLKLWAMASPTLPYDFILLDEAQDTNPAVFSVFSAQDAQRVSVGDAAQQLFAWNGSLNIMDKFRSDRHVKLTKSWRFGTAIENAANVYLEALRADLRLEGNPRVPSRIIKDSAFDSHRSAATLVRTNAGAIKELMGALTAGHDTHLIGGANTFMNLVSDAAKLQQGRRVYHPDLVAFGNWAEVEHYVEEDPSGADLKPLVNLVSEYGTTSLMKALESCVPTEEQAQTVIGTVHKVKGREWDQVRIGEDFYGMIHKDFEGGKAKTVLGPHELSRENQMLLYVAVTRAKALLDPGPLSSHFNGLLSDSSELSAALGGPDDDLPVIDNGITVPMNLQLPREVLSRLENEFPQKNDAEQYLSRLLLKSLKDR